MIHPLIKPWLSRIHEFLDEVDVDHLEHFWEKYSLHDMPIQVLGGGAIAAPILSPEFCEALLKSVEHVPFLPNMAEEPSYRINEWVLGPSDDYFLGVLSAATEAIWPLFHILYGTAPNSISSVQVARYGEPGPVGTGWHHDESSEATCTISLAPHLHTGGGTALRPTGAFRPAVTVPPLPQGWGLLFNGRTTLHRGLDVTSGVRNLLVYWMNHERIV